MLWIIGGGKSPLGSNRNAIDSDHRLLPSLPAILPAGLERVAYSSQRVPPSVVYFKVAIFGVDLEADTL